MDVNEQTRGDLNTALQSYGFVLEMFAFLTIYNYTFSTFSKTFNR